MVDFKLMRITVVCSHCIYNNSDPNIEINFSEKSIYYMCINSLKLHELYVKKSITMPFQSVIWFKLYVKNLQTTCSLIQLIY